jgi:hypothetical protein
MTTRLITFAELSAHYRYHASSSLDQTGLAKRACLTHLGRDAATDRRRRW